MRRGPATEQRLADLSWVCGDLWFLAELFVSPGNQGRGIGRELLKRTLDHAQKSGATSRALITFTFNAVSQALYIRHGLFPRLPIYNFNVRRGLLMDRLKGAQLHYEPLEDKAHTCVALPTLTSRPWECHARNITGI
jgi:GNAT superfamily N-acetyltransferase